MKPLQTLRNILVHPKDKVDPLDRSEIVYRIPCRSCDTVYIRETGRKLGTRVKEHEKDVDTNRKKAYTRSLKKESLTEISKSAITDHVNQHNHAYDIDWDSVIDRE